MIVKEPEKIKSRRMVVSGVFLRQQSFEPKQETSKAKEDT